MLFNYGYQSVILLFFVVQDLIFSFLLLKRGVKNGSQSDKWLSLLTFLCALYICPWMFGHAGWYAFDGYRETLFFIPFHQILLIGPITYFYIQSLLDKDFKVRRSDYLHLLPAALYLLYSAVIVIVDLIVLEEFYFYADGRDKDLSPWYQILGVLSMIFYTVLSLRFYRDYKRRIYHLVSFADSIKLKWVQQFLIAFGIILIIRITFLIVLPDWGDFGTKWWHYVAFGILSYYIAITGYSNTIKATIGWQEISDNDGQLTQEEPKSKPNDNIDMDFWLGEIKTKLIATEAYKNPELSLSHLAELIGLSPSNLSRAINQGYQQNFNDFINGYRVEAVKEAMVNGENRNLTLLALAIDAGFNSKTTFNRAFKKHSGTTPNEFLKQHK